MLALENVSIHYGEHVAVSEFSLALRSGEVVSIVGPTGCGKSSVLRCIAGFEPLVAGSIVLHGQTIDAKRHVSPESRNIGLVFQDFALFPHMTVAQNIGFRVSDSALVEHWLTTLGLSELRDKRPDQLSGGQKQRVALARVLAHEPQLVLLDEPLSNLDAALKSDLRWRIRDTLKTAGVAALWVTHDQAEALAVGDRIAVMRAGRLLQFAEPETCYRAPRSPFVAQFLGDGVLIPGTVDGEFVRTSVGAARYLIGDQPRPSGASVNVLIRPHDIALTETGAGIATVLSDRYEGETRLYEVETDDAVRLSVRVSHEQKIAVGQRVATEISAHHALPVFD